MRIGINTLFMVPGDVGGSETYLCETLSSLIDCFPENEFALFTNRENAPLLKRRFNDFPQTEFIDIDVFAANRPLRILNEQIRLPRKIRNSNIDLLWSPGITTPFLSNLPHVVSILDMQYKNYPEDFTFGARIATDIMIAGAIRKARSVLTISEFSKKEIIKHVRFPEEKIHPTLLGVAQDFFDDPPKEDVQRVVRRCLNLDEPYIFCVAHSYPHKNLHMLINAFGSVLSEIPHHLLLLGKPRLGEPFVQEALGALENAERVHRIEQVSRKELMAFYKGADCFVFPSLYEGFGLPVVEAMASGLPVIAAHRGSVPEVGGEAIRYFEPETDDGLARAILEVLSMGAKERNRTIEKGIKRAKTFTWKRTAEKTMACFKDSLGY